MTRDDEFIGQVKGYLDEYEGLTPLPDVVRDTVRAQLPTTRQIGPVTGLMRDIYMNSSMDTPARWGLVAAVVIGAVIIGGALFFGGGGVGTQPEPTPSPSATASEAAVPSPTGPGDFAAHPVGTVAPGDWAFTHIPRVRVVFTVPSGWERNIPDSVIWSIEDDKATMGAFTVDNLYIDPCQLSLGLLDPAVGPTVDDLATALGGVSGVTFTAPAAVTQDGASGVRLDYVPPDEFGGCQPGGDILLGVGGEEELYAPTGDDPISFYIYDVGGTRVVISAFYTPQRADDLDAMLASIRFE